MNAKLIETRLLKHHDDGTWAGYSYAWNEAQTEATLVAGGARGAFNDPQWIYPSNAQCLQCHTEAAGRSLGLETQQLDRYAFYPTTNRNASQLTTLVGIGVLNGDPSSDPLPDPTNSDEDLNSRARAYLHTNCSQCHRPSGASNVDVDLRFETDFSDTATCNVDPQNGDLGLNEPKRIVPGNPNDSVLWQRMSTRDLHAMPPIGSYQVDDVGTELIRQWILAMQDCNTFND